MNVVMNVQVPQSAEKFSITLGSVSFSRRTLLHGVCVF